MQSPIVPCSNSTSPASSSTVSGSCSVGEVRHQLDDAVGQRQHPGVVGGDDHHPVPGGQFADEPQHLLDLNVVEVGGRLVGEDQRRVECDRPRDRHPLLLTAAEVTGPVVHPLRQPDPGQQLLGPLAGLAARHPAPPAAGTITFSSAVRLGTRLNAWKTMPTVSRR